MQILETEQFGQCADFEAIPGFGLQCKISQIESLLKEKSKDSEDVDAVDSESHENSENGKSREF